MNRKAEVKIRKRRLFRDFFIIGISILIALYIQTFARNDFIGYFSGIYFIPAAIITGFLFSLTFTAAISTSVFILLAGTEHNAFIIAFLGGLGSVAGNSLVFKFFKDEFIDDVRAIEPKSAQIIAHKILHSKLFAWLIPYIAALSLASPLPDEIGIFLIAGTRFKYSYFLLISFILHSAGILGIVLLGEYIM